MTTVRVDRRDRWVSVANSTINDSRVSFRARGILVWLLAKPDDWRTSSERIAAETTEGRDAIRTAMKELETTGYLVREKLRHEDGTFETVLTVRETPAPGNPASVNQSSDSQASYEGLRQTTDNKESSSLRSEELNAREGSKPQKVLIAQAYWDWHLEENGGPPAQDFKALMAVVQACLKREYAPDEIIDAMKFTRSGMTAAKVIDRIGLMRRAAENRASTAAIPTAVLQDLAVAKPWFEERWPGWYEDNRARLFATMATLKQWGFDVGESMVRLAVAMQRPDLVAPSPLSNLQIDRFPGRIAPDQIVGTMERAYRNKSWRAS